MVLAANAPAGELYGKPHLALTGVGISELCPAAEHDALILEIASCNGRPRSFTALQTRENDVFVGSFSAKSCHEDDLDHVVLIVREMEQSPGLCESDLTLRTMMLNHVSDGIVCYTPEGELLFANRTSLATWGVESLQEARALGPFGWMAEEMRSGLAERLTTVLKQGEARFESHGTAPNGEPVHLEISSTLVHHGSDTYILSSVRDITERIRAEEMVRYLAYHDTLTGLANRVLLESELAHAISLSDRHGDVVGVVFLDLDDFKPVNDTYGHTVGDHVLRVVADRLAGAVRDHDTVARSGGDEFVILLPRLTEEGDAAAVARKLSEEVARPITIGSETIQVNASVGVAVHEAGEDAESLLTRADLSMYRSREDGIPGWMAGS